MGADHFIAQGYPHVACLLANIAASSTVAGAEPGTAKVRTGMMAPGTQALSPVSAAIRPSIEPLPNFSFSLLARLAAA